MRKIRVIEILEGQRGVGADIIADVYNVSGNVITSPKAEMSLNGDFTVLTEPAVWKNREVLAVGSAVNVVNLCDFQSYLESTKEEKIIEGLKTDSEKKPKKLFDLPDFKNAVIGEAVAVESAEDKEIAWLKARLGMFTSSRAHSLATCDKTGQDELLPFIRSTKVGGLHRVDADSLGFAGFKGGEYAKLFHGGATAKRIDVVIKLLNDLFPQIDSEESLQYWLSVALNGGIVSKRDFLPTGAVTYAEEKAREEMTIFEYDGYVSPAMRHGKETEHLAIAAFSATTGLVVSKCKVSPEIDNQEFILADDGVSGCTPDGVVDYSEQGENSESAPITWEHYKSLLNAGFVIEGHSGVESKCPDSATHLSYFSIIDAETLKSIEPAYYWQIQDSMRITGATHWYFVSFDNRFIGDYEHLQLHWCVIKRNDDDIAFYEKRLAMSVEHKNTYLAKFKK